MTSLAGVHRAKAVEGALGYTSGGSEQVAVRFGITEGECKGRYITWYGYFTEKTTDRTLESLRACGWEGDDLFALDGITKNEVELVIEEEEGQDGEIRPKVRWVNAAGGLALKSRMPEGDARAFAARMKGAVVAHRQKTAPSAERREQRRPPQSRNNEPPPPTDDDMPF